MKIGYHTAAETALLIAQMMKRYSKTRARVSRKSISTLSNRSRLRGAFITELNGNLQELGWVLVELDSGGFGLAALRALEGAGTVVPHQMFAIEELEDIESLDVDWVEVEDEVFED